MSRKTKGKKNGDDGLGQETEVSHLNHIAHVTGVVDKRMKGHAALFPNWLRDITSKSVDKSESGLFDSDCRRFFRRSVSENIVPFSHEKVSFCPSLSPTYVASF